MSGVHEDPFQDPYVTERHLNINHKPISSPSSSDPLLQKKDYFVQSAADFYNDRLQTISAPALEQAVDYVSSQNYPESLDLKPVVKTALEKIEMDFDYYKHKYVLLSKTAFGKYTESDDLEVLFVYYRTNFAHLSETNPFESDRIKDLFSFVDAQIKKIENEKRVMLAITGALDVLKLEPGQFTITGEQSQTYKRDIWRFCKQQTLLNVLISKLESGHSPIDSENDIKLLWTWITDIKTISVVFSMRFFSMSKELSQHRLSAERGFESLLDIDEEKNYELVYAIRLSLFSKLAFLVLYRLHLGTQQASLQTTLEFVKSTIDNMLGQFVENTIGDTTEDGDQAKPPSALSVSVKRFKQKYGSILHSSYKDDDDDVDTLGLEKIAIVYNIVLLAAMFSYYNVPKLVQGGTKVSTIIIDYLLRMKKEEMGRWKKTIETIPESSTKTYDRYRKTIKSAGSIIDRISKLEIYIGRCFLRIANTNPKSIVKKNEN